MEVHAVLVDDNPDNLRGMLAALDGVTTIRFEGETITSKFHCVAPVLFQDGKLNLEATIASIRGLQPGVAIIDMRLEGDDPEDFSGVKLSAELASRYGDCCVIPVSSFFDLMPPSFFKSLEEIMQFIDRTRPVELFERDLQDQFTQAVVRHVGRMKRRHLASSTPAPPRPEPEKGPPHSRKAVYISYAWGDQREIGPSREDIVNRLDK